MHFVEHSGGRQLSTCVTEVRMCVCKRACMQVCAYECMWFSLCVYACTYECARVHTKLC
jgi:hypothetical protein